MLLVSCVVHEHVHNFIPDYRVQSGGGFIQQQKLCSMAHGDGDAQFHLHSPGKVLEGFSIGKRELLDQLQKLIPVPVAESVAHDLFNLLQIQTFGDAYIVCYNADIFFYRPYIFAVVLSQDHNSSAVLFQDIQDQLDCGAFSGSVLANKAHNAACGQGYIQIFQPEPGEAFT